MGILGESIRNAVIGILSIIFFLILIIGVCFIIWQVVKTKADGIINSLINKIL